MTESTMVSRRSIAKGSAWAAPAIVLGAAAPATAASPQPGLQGWVDVITSCLRNPQTISIDGTGNYPAHGLWVFDAQPADLKDAAITFYFPNSLGDLSWSFGSGSAGWSLLTKNGSDQSVPGYTAYITRYTDNTWAYVQSGSSQPYSRVTKQPEFTALLRSPPRCQAVSVYARRTVTVKGTPISFLRGPVELNPFAARSAPQRVGGTTSAPSADGAQTTARAIAPSTADASPTTTAAAPSSASSSTASPSSATEPTVRATARI